MNIAKEYGLELVNTENFLEFYKKFKENIVY